MAGTIWERARTAALDFGAGTGVEGGAGGNGGGGGAY